MSDGIRVDEVSVASEEYQSVDPVMGEIEIRRFWLEGQGEDGARWISVRDWSARVDAERERAVWQSVIDRGSRFSAAQWMRLA